MAQGDTSLKEILGDLFDTLEEMSVSELEILANKWYSLKTYSEQSDARRLHFYSQLDDIIQKSPTLIKNGFANVLLHSTRFSDKPVPTLGATQLGIMQGMPPVHNEIVRIAQKIDELLAQSKSKD